MSCSPSPKKNLPNIGDATVIVITMALSTPAKRLGTWDRNTGEAQRAKGLSSQLSAADQWGYGFGNGVLGGGRSEGIGLYTFRLLRRRSEFKMAFSEKDVETGMQAAEADSMWLFTFQVSGTRLWVHIEAVIGHFGKQSPCAPSQRKEETLKTGFHFTLVLPSMQISALRSSCSRPAMREACDTCPHRRHPAQSLPATPPRDTL